MAASLTASRLSNYKTLGWRATGALQLVRPCCRHAMHTDLIRKHDSDGDGKLTMEEVSALLQEFEVSGSYTVPGNVSAPAVGGQASNPHQPSGAPTWDAQVHIGLAHAKVKGWSSLLQSLLQAKVLKPRLASDVIWGALGMFLGVLSLGCLNLFVKQLPGAPGIWHTKGLNLLLGSFGTICVLLFARPEAEAIRAWNLIVGHVLSISVVVAVISVMGPGIVSRALAMALALVGMVITDSVHPPGGALVLLAEDSAAVQSMAGWFLIYPSLTWTIGILLPIGATVNWLRRTHKFDWPWRHKGRTAQQQLPAAEVLKALATGPALVLMTTDESNDLKLA